MYDLIVYYITCIKNLFSANLTVQTFWYVNNLVARLIFLFSVILCYNLLGFKNLSNSKHFIITITFDNLLSFHKEQENQQQTLKFFLNLDHVFFKSILKVYTFRL